MDQVKKKKEDQIHFIFLIAVIVSIVLMVKCSPLLQKGLVRNEYYNHDFEEGLIVDVVKEDLVQDPVVHNMYTGRQEVEVQVLSGEYKGEVFHTVNRLDFSHNVLTKKGMKVIVGINRAKDVPKERSVWVYNYKRNNSLLGLFALFCGLLLVFGRKKGLDAIVALIFTATLLLFVFLPLVFNGKNIILTSTLMALIALSVSFSLVSGFNQKTLASILGTMCGIIVAGSIAAIFSKVCHISVINLDKGTELAYISNDYGFDINGLMYAGILIASLGAIMDVAMSIASSMFEIVRITPNISFKDLYKSGMNIGKDIMGTMTNTLILAFIGSSFSLILLLYGYHMTYMQISNLPFIAVEVVRGISGSIGIVLTVPFTALFAGMLYKKKLNKV